MDRYYCFWGLNVWYLAGYQLVTCKNQVFDTWTFILLQFAKTTTRKTTTGYRVTLDIDQWQEKFDYYEDVKVCFKNVSRDYDLSKITSDFELDDLEIDFLLGKISKKELKEERYWHDDDYFKTLENYKKNYEVVWLSFGEHSQISIWYGDDGIMLVEKGSSQEFINELRKELNAWFNWWIYCVSVYEPENYINENNGEHDLIHWNYVDGQWWYFEPEEALNSLPDYAGEIIKDTETERFEEFERC